GFRTGSRRPPCGATRTSGSVPEMTSGRTADGTAGSLAFRRPTVYMPPVRWPVAALLLLGCVTRASALDRPHVYLIVVDGLDARFATAARMPRLFELTTRDPERSSTFLDARAVIPTRTHPNHVSLPTGTYPEAHGITGNSYWARAPA